MARKKPTTPQLTEQSTALAEFAAGALIASEHLGIKTKPIQDFPLEEIERAIVTELSTLPAIPKKKLLKKNAKFTIADTASMVMALAESLLDGEPLIRLHLLFIAKKLIDCLQKNIATPDVPAKKPKPTDAVYQLKITLIESYPPIWRRIHVQDCTLDKLHEHIQTAMGWENSHLHHFIIDKQYYGDPELMQRNFEYLGYEDSTTTLLSDILPKNKRRFRFHYEYDFGDSWRHAILLERVVKDKPKVKLPVCLEGERACPPEDCGGIWSYPDFVEAIQNPDHERHEERLEWVGGSFDAERFDPANATKAMRKGLPDWRNMMG